METANHQLAKDFFNALQTGEVPGSLITEDFHSWTLSSGNADRAQFCGGIKLFAAVISGGPVYQIKSLTAEDNRVVAETHSTWQLINGETVESKAVFIMEISDGKIASVKEYMDPSIPREKLGPLIHKILSEQKQ